MRFPLSGLLIYLLAAGAILGAPEAPRPNILLILADDLGYSDLGCYGGEIATPNLDALARGGLRFTQFYNTARCWPSRAAILTGYYAQQVRRDTVPGVPSGTSGTRPPWARLLPEKLKPLGYRTYHSGKWHLDGRPLQNGFDHSYSLNDHDRYFSPQLHTEEDVALPAVPTNSGYYATTAIADHAIKCLREHASKHAAQPFFEYLAFTAPHFPVQALPADIAHYRDRYVPGWEVLREERWQRMQGLGIGGRFLSAIEREVGPPYAFPEALKELGPLEVNRPVPWMGLSSAQRKFQADKMAVHAAMVERMDREIGRVLAQIRAMGVLENTLIVFLSDNGASAEMMVRGDGHNPDAECGTGATFLSIGPGWSSLANTPFRRHKTWVHEGGISTPFIVHWPHGVAARGELRQTPSHLIDLAPTFLELAGAKPAEVLAGQPVPTAPGHSLVPLFERDGAVTHDFLWWLHEGNRALRAGNWKLVAAGSDHPRELYDLSADRSEGRNLAESLPEKVRELSEVWQRQTEAYMAQARKDFQPPYPSWQHTGSLFINTTPDGANLPTSTAESDFPLLIRLDRDFFNFSEARPQGEDLRFATAAGMPLRYQIETWDAEKGGANVWVRWPMIQGNTRQELKMYWGQAEAASESSGSAVFNGSNGYLSVWHMTGPPKDEVGSVAANDGGTTGSVGMVGAARHFAGGQGIFGGEKITNYPHGSESHSSEAWFRPEKLNTTVLAWGNEQAQGKVVMQFRSPPHISMDCYFSDGNVQSRTPLPNSEWVHVVHAYEKGNAKLYVNGILDGTLSGRSAPLALKHPARLWLGGWYDHYDFVGDLDEVRISKVARSADWVRLEYENQKPFQTLVGPIVQTPKAFTVSPAQVAVLEGKSVIISAEVSGAQKVYWILKRGGHETVVAVDRATYAFEAGRVTGNQSLTLLVMAVYANEIQTREIPVTIQEDIPEPTFTLAAPTTWNGRSTIEVVPQVSNLDVLRAKGVWELNIAWSVAGPATIRESVPGKLILFRSQNSGKMTVTATIRNGGQPSTQSTTLLVTEPERDPWVARKPSPDEQPEDNQFYARSDQGEGILYYNGKLTQPADSVFLRVFADGQLYRQESLNPANGQTYAFTVKLRPGLIRYHTEFGNLRAGHETVLRTVTNIVCGDAYLIIGQSNAVATDWGDGEPTFRSPWIRTYGTMSSEPKGLRLWGEAVHRSRDEEKLQIGYWGMELARRLVESQQIPICILNGAVGGTRIDQHQRNAENPGDLTTIYGRLLWRVQQAGLTHGIKGILWHQGENDQGADGPTGGFGWETYRQYFIDLAAAWKQDYPNLQHYYVFQIWPKSCAMGVAGSDNRLREVQRMLPTAFSKLSVMSTLGIEPPGGCHYPAAGYSEFARLIEPLLQRDFYGMKFSNSITPPDLQRLYFTKDRPDQLTLEFDQPVKWEDVLLGQFYLNGENSRVSAGSASGNLVTLHLKAPVVAGDRLTYLDSSSWSQKSLLRGANGLAALTFCEVPVLSAVPSR